MSATAVPIPVAPKRLPQDRPLFKGDTKRCRDCLETKEVTRYFYESDHRGYYYPNCAACRRAAMSVYRATSPIALASRDDEINRRAAIRLVALDSGAIARLRLRKRKPRSMSSDHIKGATDGTRLTAWGASSYTEMALSTMDSFVHFAEAFMEVYEERVGRHLSEDARAAFQKAVEQRARDKVAGDRSPPSPGPYQNGGAW